jgi:hypothetical protein
MLSWLNMIYLKCRYPIGSKVRIVDREGQYHVFKVDDVVEVTNYHFDYALICKGISKNTGNEIEQIVYPKNVKLFSR